MAQEGPGVQGSQVEIAEVGAEFGPELLAQALAPGPDLLQQACGVLGEPGSRSGPNRNMPSRSTRPSSGSPRWLSTRSQL